MPTKKEAEEISKEAKELSIEEIESRIHALDEKVQDLRDHKAILHAELDRKVELEAAIRKVETLSNSEMAALLQHMKAEGIPTREEVGQPGNEE